MFELGLGIVLAVWFVTAYFIYRKVFERDETVWTSYAIKTPHTQELAEKQPKLFLTTSEMSEHHETEGRR